jgi:hypothetical protein
MASVRSLPLLVALAVSALAFLVTVLRRLLRVVYASHLREDRREVRDLLDLSKSKRMFWWFSYLVDSGFASIYLCI